MQTHQYDAVVIGAGSGGLTAAVGLSKVGKKVLLLEREHMGGECTNTGCIPSKALLHHAKSFYQAKQLAGITEQSETYRKEAFTYVRSIINEVLGEETEEHFKAQGIDVIMGEAVFTGKRALTVAGVNYSFKKAVIATGSSPRPLVVEGLRPEQVVTNQNIFNLEGIPERLLVIGAGPIGMELGQALAMLGSHVTIVDNGPRLARLEDEAISPIIASAFKELGITVLHNAEVTKVEGDVAIVSLKDTSETTAVPFDIVLVAIGRVPNIPKGLEAAGVTTTPHGVTVNSNWQSSNKNIYALGDVAARLKFTHVADDTARQVVTHLVSYGLISVKEKQVPKVTYTEPEMAQVGLSWSEAIDMYAEENLHRIEVLFGANDRARTDDATGGLLIIIAKRLTGHILGAHIIGPRAGELIGTITLAMENNLSLYRLRNTIFAYPTYSLILKKAGDYFLAKQIATLKSDLLTVVKSLAPKVIALCIWGIALYTIYHLKMVNNLSFTDIAINLFNFISSTAWGPVIYILAYAIRPLTFFPGTLLTILSGIFFGIYEGIIYTIIGASLSATVAYFVGRFFSQSLTGIKKLLGGWITFLHEQPFMAILTMRLTFFPFDLVAYGAGLFKIPYAQFLLGTVTGTLLGITTFVAIGASLSVEEFIENGITAEAIDGKFIALSAVIFILSLVVSKVIQKKPSI